MGDTPLQPGNNIKPVVSEEQARNIIRDSYGLVVGGVFELNGYDDINYKVAVDDVVDNEHIENICEFGYVLKVTNSLDSKNVAFVEGQNALMLYLEKNKISCPRLAKTKQGSYYTIKELKSGSHVVRLLEFIPGTILHQIPCTKDLFYQAGEYIAKIDVALEKFRHPVYKTHKTIWMLDSVPQLRQFISAISDENRRKIVLCVIKEFEDRVLSIRNTFETGMIHGDFNEQNIIVNKTDGSWKIQSVLDFGDSHFSCYLYELAITMTYMMILGKDLNVGGHVIAGYTSVKQINSSEMDLLKVICICARLCQSLVLGAYTSLQDPENLYLLTTAKSGWQLLLTLWDKPEELLLQNWRNVALEYKLNRHIM